MTFLVSFAMALVLTRLVAWLGLATGLTDKPDEEELKIHRRPISVLGGVAVIAGASAAMAIMGRWPSWGVGTAVMIALVAGLVDDAHPIPAAPRILLLAAAGTLLVVGTGIRLAGFPESFGVVLLVVSCANAVDIVDGQDGLAGGLVAIGALGLALLSAMNRDEMGIDLSLALAGASTGFVAWNWPSARVFLGNGGAYGVGVLLALLAARVIHLENLQGVLAAGACLGVFAFEVVFTVSRRIVSHGRVMVGDRLHSYDIVASRVTAVWGVRLWRSRPVRT